MKISHLAIALAVVSTCSIGTHAIANASDDSPPPSVSAPADAIASARIPTKVMALLNEQGIKATPITSGSAAVAASNTNAARSAAVAAARKAFGLNSRSPAQSVTLVSLTTSPPAPGSEHARAKTKPAFKDQVVWLVTLDNVPNPYRGPMQAHIPKAVPGTMVAPVDPVTGKVLFAFVG